MTTIFQYDTRGRLIAESDPDGTVTREYIYLNELPVGDQPSTTGLYFIHPDHLNTPRMIANSTGATVWRWDQQEPFGNDSPNADPNSTGVTFDFNLKFPGQYFDRETNLAYNYYRTYSPEIGRYVESDPIGLASGLNTYAYVYDNPISFVDPQGLESYQCIRPLGGKPGGYVSPGNATHHQYSCIVLPNGESKCGGLGPSGSAIRSPGKPTSPEEDYFKVGACNKTQDDNSCFEQCLQDEWQKPLPTYSFIWGLGTQCQEYDDDVNRRCRKKCILK